jgi:hypothetical protein
LNHLKRILPIGLLILLLYNIFGLAIGVFFFENDFQVPSATQEDGEYKTVKFAVTPLPYSTSWENADGMPGLFSNEGEFYNIIHQKIENDTAYITLKTNISARERFLELADQIANTGQGDLANETPVRKAIRALSDLVKVYWHKPFHALLTFTGIAVNTLASFSAIRNTFISPVLASLAPPPER